MLFTKLFVGALVSVSAVSALTTPVVNDKGYALAARTDDCGGGGCGGGGGGGGHDGGGHGGGDHGPPPKGITPGQWQDVWTDCENQVQNGLINIGVAACVVAAVQAILDLLTNN